MLRKGEAYRIAMHKSHYHTLYIYSVISPKPFFISVACQGHILKSTRGIEMKLDL